MSTRGASASESSLIRNFTNERAGERAAPLRTGRSVNHIYFYSNCEDGQGDVFTSIILQLFQTGRQILSPPEEDISNTMVSGTSCFESRSEKGSERKIPRHCKGEERSSGAKRRGAPHHQPSRQGATETWSWKRASKTRHYSGGHLASADFIIKFLRQLKSPPAP